MKILKKERKEKKKLTEEVLSEIFAPDPVNFLFSDLGREILEAGAREKGVIFFVHGLEGMGKTSLALWLEREGEKRKDISVVLAEGSSTEVLPSDFLHNELKLSFAKWLSGLIAGRSPTPKVLIVVDDFHLIPPRDALCLLHLLDIPFVRMNLVLLSSFPPEDLRSWKVLSNYYYTLQEMKMPKSQHLLEFIKVKLSDYEVPPDFPNLDIVEEAYKKAKSVREVLEFVLEPLLKKCTSAQVHKKKEEKQKEEEEKEEMVRRIREALGFRRAGRRSLLLSPSPSSKFSGFPRTLRQLLRIQPIPHLFA